MIHPTIMFTTRISGIRIRFGFAAADLRGGHDLPLGGVRGGRHPLGGRPLPLRRLLGVGVGRLLGGARGRLLGLPPRGKVCPSRDLPSPRPGA